MPCDEATRPAAPSRSAVRETAASAACSGRGCRCRAAPRAAVLASRDLSQGKDSRLCRAAAPGGTARTAPRATCTSMNAAPSGSSAARKAQSATRGFAQQLEIAPHALREPSRRMFWKSTAILVQTTSRPTVGRRPRRGQVWGDNTSEAVRSGCRGSVGAIAMRLRGSPVGNCTCGSTVCHPKWVETRMRHTVSPLPEGSRIHWNSRTGYQEYKISACIGGS